MDNPVAESRVVDLTGVDGGGLAIRRFLYDRRLRGEFSGTWGLYDISGWGDLAGAGRVRFVYVRGEDVPGAVEWTDDIYMVPGGVLA